MRLNTRLLASHAHKTPLILSVRPPAPPVPNAAAPGSGNASAGPSKQPSRSSSAPSSHLPKPRPNYTRLLADPSTTTLNHLRRASGLSEDHVAHVSRLRSTQLVLIGKLESIRRKQNEIGMMIKNGLGERDELVRQAKKLKGRVGEYEVNLQATEEELLEMTLALPNFSSASTPVGREELAVEIKRFGPQTLCEARPDRDHLRIADHFDLLDNEASATATGASWPYLRGAAALLEMALINYAVSLAVKRGFTPVVPPDVVKIDVATRCGFLPRDSGGAQQTFTLSPASGKDADPTLCLAGTAEVPLAALFANRVLNNGTLPAKVVGVGHAFRAEAGARGADTRGLYRVHQFTKVELFAVTQADAEQSSSTMTEMLELQEEIISGLGLSVRVLEMPTEELGASAYRKVDMEAWMPGRGKWGEISSTSECTDYQSRRLHIRYKPNTAPPPPGPEFAAQSSGSEPLPFAYTLNGTAAAVPRLILALLEYGARLGEGGKVEGLDLPVALRQFWVGGDELVAKDGTRSEIRWI